jgi:type III pantothenate kinase
MNLLIDQGNSFCKIVVYSNNNLFDFYKLSKLNTEGLLKIISKHNPKKCILSSVKNVDHNVLDLLKSINTFHELSNSSKLPVEIKYKTTNTLGKDRIATSVAANSIFPDMNILVIDFGTAITYDFIEHTNTFIGGNISPGLTTRFKALNTETNQLPLLERKEIYPLIGDDTHNAIISGVQTGIINEILGYINYMESNFSSFKVVFTGGDGPFFAKKIKKTIFVEPNLIFIGLNKILEYNV